MLSSRWICYCGHHRQIALTVYFGNGYRHSNRTFQNLGETWQVSEKSASGLISARNRSGGFALARTISRRAPARFASPDSRLKLWRRRSFLQSMCPPESVGGRELLLTCRSCNNSSGTKLDAHARIKEDVNLAVAGTLEHPHRVRARFAAHVLNPKLHTQARTYSLPLPTNLTKPPPNTHQQ